MAITNSTDSGDSGGSVTPETMAITNSTDSGDSGGSVTPETMAITNSTDSGDSGGSVTPETMAITNSTDSGDSGGSVTPETMAYEANSISASKSLGRNIDQHITTISKNMSLEKTSDINSENHPPVAGDQSVIVYANKPIKIVLRGTDQDNDLTTFELVSPPAKGVLSGFSETTGTVTYVTRSYIYRT